MNGTSIITDRIPPPLSVAPDMLSSWVDFRGEHFDDAAERIISAHKNDGEAFDQPVMNLATWGVVPVEGRFALAPLGKQHGPRILRATAFSNLMARYGAPAEFIRDRLPAPLQLAIANWLTTSSDKAAPAMLRLRGEEVAAVVSDRYAPLDQEPLLDCVRAALAEQNALDEVEVKSIATGVTDVIRLVFPSEQEAIKVGDVSALGLDISSSSFGRSAVHVRGIVWRLVCTNGLRAPEGAGAFSFRHVGDAQRLRASIAEAIPSALAVARGTLGRWKTAVDILVHDVAAMIAELQDLTAGERRLVEERVQIETGMPKLPERAPLYDVLNGITSAAHAFVPARRLEVESMAGQLLSSRTREP